MDVGNGGPDAVRDRASDGGGDHDGQGKATAGLAAFASARVAPDCPGAGAEASSTWTRAGQHRCAAPGTHAPSAHPFTTHDHATPREYGTPPVAPASASQGTAS